MRYSWIVSALAAKLCTISPLSANEPVTNPLRTDGFGAQFQTIIYSMIYAELTGSPYLYSPFSSMEHNYDNDPNFLKNLEKLINLIDHYPINEDVNLQNQLTPSQFVNFFESNLEAGINSRALGEVKRLFRSNKERKDYFGDESFSIALHVRRPNAHDSRIEGTDTPDALFVNTIDMLRREYNSKNPVFHLFSQGDEEEFRKVYQGDDIVFHINGSTEESFAMMVFADVLVTSRSSFSYIAGILSNGTVYYIPFWHPPMPHWKVIH